jgi:hypothetical protein
MPQSLAAPSSQPSPDALHSIKRTLRDSCAFLKFSLNRRFMLSRTKAESAQ